jgi:cobalt-zinc-cadmium efflux system membrane fusion protein
MNTIRRQVPPWSRALPALGLPLLLAACGGAGSTGSVTAEPGGNAERAVHEAHEEGVVELGPEAAANADLRTAEVAERRLENVLETTGQVDFDQTRLAHVSPRITGRVHRVHARLGAVVGAGDRLAEVDSIELGRAKADFLQARARAELARRIHERERTLFADRISSEQELLSAEAELREATAALGTAEEILHLYGLDQGQVDALSYDDPKASIYPLRAPFGGTVVERHATLGELVTPEKNLFTLADLDRVWIWIDVYQRDLARVHLEDRVTVRVDAYPGELFTGTVSYLGSRVDADTRTVRARLDVDNPDRRLRPGMFVEVVIRDPHGTGGSPVTVVPESAVQRDGGRLLVFVAEGERRYRRREIDAGRSAGGWVEVLSGVDPGEEVVVEGAFLLKSATAEDRLGGGHHH